MLDALEQAIRAVDFSSGSSPWPGVVTESVGVQRDYKRLCCKFCRSPHGMTEATVSGVKGWYCQRCGKFSIKPVYLVPDAANMSETRVGKARDISDGYLPEFAKVERLPVGAKRWLLWAYTDKYMGRPKVERQELKTIVFDVFVSVSHLIEPSRRESQRDVDWAVLKLCASIVRGARYGKTAPSDSELARLVKVHRSQFARERRWWKVSNAARGRLDGWLSQIIDGMAGK